MGLYFGVVFSRRQTGRQQQLLASWPPSSDSYSKNKQQHSWGDANFVKVVKSTSQSSLQVWKAYVISELYLFRIWPTVMMWSIWEKSVFPKATACFWKCSLLQPNHSSHSNFGVVGVILQAGPNNSHTGSYHQLSTSPMRDFCTLRINPKLNCLRRHLSWIS